MSAASSTKPATLSVDDTEHLYWDIVFCANNINGDGSLSEFLTAEELERVYTMSTANQTALNLYIEDKKKLSSNWNKLQTLYSGYQTSLRKGGESGETA